MYDETFAEAWRLRYGTDPELPVPELARFLCHRSVRAFDHRPIDTGLRHALMACAQSAATSSNLQLWSAISIDDPDRREAIAALCADQDQVRQAPWFVAFLADHHRLRRAARKHGEEAAGLDYIEFFAMAVIDAALAAERMVCAAQAIGLGVCYIGALRNDAEGVRALLELPEGVFGAFGLCLGWPHPEAKAEIKPRLAQDAVWFQERYDPASDTDEYDSRMTPFYLAQGMRGEVTWSMRSGRRVDGRHMSGRDRLMDLLRELGFARR